MLRGGTGTRKKQPVSKKIQRARPYAAFVRDRQGRPGKARRRKKDPH